MDGFARNPARGCHPLTKTATGVSITGSVDGESLTFPDTTPVITAFSRIVVGHGYLNTDFHVDNVRIELTRSRPPVFTANPLVRPTAFVGLNYVETPNSDVADPNPDDALTFSKVSGPAWLSLAPDGTLTGTPALADAGPNSFVVRVTDDSGLTAETTVTISVVNSAIETWRQQQFGTDATNVETAGNAADPDGDGRSNLLEFALHGDPNSGASGGLEFARILDGVFTYTLAVRAGATFTSQANRQTATVDGLTYAVEASQDLADWNLSEPVTEVIPALTVGLPAPNSGWEYHTFRNGGPAVTPRIFFRSRIEAP